MTQPVRGILEDEQKGILLNDFTGGLVTDIGGLSLGPNQSPDCLNVFAWEGNLRWRGGYAQFATLPGPADGAFEYFDINDNAHTIEWAAGNMYDTTAGGNPVLIASGVYTPGQHIAHAQLNGVLYWATITVPLRQYNGTTEQAVSNAGGTGVVPPPACNFLIDFNGSLVAVDFVVAGVRNAGSFIWSNVNDAHTWVGANVQAVGSNDGSVCVFALLMGVAQVGVSPTKQFMVAKNNQKIFLYEGALGSLIENPVSSPVGVLDGKSAVYVPTQAGLGAVVFLGDDQQIYQTNGIECQMISTNIKLLCSQLVNSAVNLTPNQKFNAIYHQRYQYYLIDFGNNTQLAYKWDTGAWWYFHGWPSGVFCSTIASNGLPTIFVGANNGSTTGVYELALDATNDNGNTIQAYWSSPYIHGGKPERLKCFEQVTLFTYNVGVQYQVTSVGMPRSDGVAPATKPLIFNDAAVGAVQSLPGNGMTWNRDKWNQAYWGGVQNTAGANPPINGMKGPLCVPAPATKWGPAGFPQPYETGGARFIISWNKGVPDFKVTSLKVSFIWRNENVGILPGTSFGQVVATTATGPNKFTNTGQLVPLPLPAPPTPPPAGCYSIIAGQLSRICAANEYVVFALGNIDQGTSDAVWAWDNNNQYVELGIIDPSGDDGNGESGIAVDLVNNVMYSQMSRTSDGALLIGTQIAVSGTPTIGGVFAPPAQVLVGGGTYFGGTDDQFQWDTVILSPDRAHLYVLASTVRFGNNTVVLKVDTTTGAIAAASAVFATQQTAFGLLLSPDGTKIYTASYGTSGVGYLEVIALNTADMSTVNATQVLTGLGTGQTPTGMAISPDGTQIAVTLQKSFVDFHITCFIFDTGALTFSNFAVGVSSGFSGVCTFPQGDSAHVLIYLNGSLLTFTLAGAAGTVYALGIPNDSGANQILTEPNTGLIYGVSYTSGGNNSMWVYNLATTTLITNQPVIPPTGGMPGMCFAT